MHKLSHLGLAYIYEFHCLVCVLFGRFNRERKYDGIYGYELVNRTNTKGGDSTQAFDKDLRDYGIIPKISCGAYATYSAAIRMD